MEFLVNDLSISGQFANPDLFRDAVRRVMKIRQRVRRSGRELYCHKNLAHAQVTPEMIMPQAIKSLGNNESRALMGWLTRRGSFWEDARGHSSDDWFECKGTIVTDTAIGEAAWHCFNDTKHALVSFTPSDWEYSPVTVDRVLNDDNGNTVGIENYWELDVIDTLLNAASPPPTSWRQLNELAQVECTELNFTMDPFQNIKGTPFSPSAADRLSFLLKELNRLQSCSDSKGQRTPEGHEIYNKFFARSNALFSDSSETEKRRFEKEMTFKLPRDTNKTIFCPWHGKVKTPPLRVHFSWPVQPNEPLYIAYVGPKITKR